MSTKSRGFEPSADGVGGAVRTAGHSITIALLCLAVATAIVMAGSAALALAPVLPGPSHSTNIALTSDNLTLVVANPEANTVSVMAVLNAKHQDLRQKLAEVPVGIEPHCVAISPDNHTAFVTNAVSGTVSVVSLVNFTVTKTILVGAEPRGCALTPSGGTLYVANHTSGTVSIIDTTTFTVVKTLVLGGNPYAVAITNLGHGNDAMEEIFVTDFFAQLVPGGPGEGFDTGKQGRVFTFPFGHAPFLRSIPLSPLKDVGFTADRTAFCPSPTNPKLHSTIFCPKVADITKDPQGCFPNQLYSGVIRGNRLRLSTICAEPEPPVTFNTNIQAVVKSVDTGTLNEVVTEDDNINKQIKTETSTVGLKGLFLGDFAAIDATLDGSVYLLVSRNNDYVLKAKVDPITNQLVINAPNNVVRFQTGHIPTGVVISTDGTRAYTNNEVNGTVSVLALATNSVPFPELPVTDAPAPGTLDAVVRLGKLVFFTGLGVPDDSSIFSTPIQNINTLANRGKASANGWSSCASCHPDGLSDHVTWIFPAGPRRSIPLDGTIDKDNPLNSRVLLWSATRDSNVDFNQNSIGVQKGTGWAAGQPNASAIYDHGITEGVPPLDALTTWVQFGARPLLQPTTTNPTQVAAGAIVFQNNCAICHGGPKWTKSEIMYINDPSFTSNPNVVPPATPGTPIDPGINVGITGAGEQIVSLTRSNNTFEKTFKYLENVGTFNPANPLEIRGQGATAGQLALGGLGFNVPSLLSIASHAPYLHDGAAQTLFQVFPLHNLGKGKISTTLNSTQQLDLLFFLDTIDGRTKTFQSEAEQFKNGE